jgi:hypothetical protein
VFGIVYQQLLENREAFRRAAIVDPHDRGVYV